MSNQLPQGISRSSFLSPAETTDGILHSITLKGGYQEMLTKEDRNNIKSFLNITGAVYDGFTQSSDPWSTGRRRVGMMIYVIEDSKFYNLIPVGFFGNGGDLGKEDWLALPEWERALRIDPSGAFTAESASPLNNFTAVIKTAADLGIPSDANSCWVESPVGVDGLDGADGSPGLSSYLHIAYANDANGTDFSQTESNDKSYIGQYTDFDPNGSSDHTKYTWTLVKGQRGDDGIDGLQGPRGEDGIPGPKGEDGLPTYFHIAYADNENGGGFSQDAAGKLYIGTYVDNIEDDAPAGDSRWKWLLVKGSDGQNGENGIPGTNGTDGQTSYLHFAYANDATGTSGFSITDSDNKLYIGQYTDFTLADSTNPAVYKWTRIKGEKGDPGERGLQGLQGADGADGVQGPPGADGQATYFHIAYADTNTGVGFSQEPVGKLYIGTYVDDIQADAPSGSFLWKWQLVKGADGQNGENGIPGTNGADGQTTYLHIAYANNATGTSGFSITDSTGRTHIGQYTDFTLEDSTNPAVYKWTLIKGEKGDPGERGLQGLQGADGADGVPGPPGADGQATYFHIAYADTASGGGFSQEPAGKDYIGTYVDDVATDAPAGDSKWKWALVKGQDGAQGTPGTNGANGQTSYLHVAYANNATGLGFDIVNSENKEWIGTYTDNLPNDSQNWSVYKWTKIKGETGEKGAQGIKGDAGAQGLQGLQGSDGQQGIPGPAGELGPQGPEGLKGETGTSSYFHIAYADNASGGGFSQEPAGKDYIGTYVDYIPTDAPAGDSRWKWALVKGQDGAQGTPGTNGANGKTTYLHIAYATSADGRSGFDVSNSTGKLYIGQYTDFIAADSTDYTKYKWSLIKGANGTDGAKGDAGTDGAKGAAGAKGATGQKGATGPAPDTSLYLTTSTNIDGGKITTGVIKNGQFIPSSGWNSYAGTGMGINLDLGAINAKNFYISPDGDAKFKGDMDIEGGVKVGGSLMADFFEVAPPAIGELPILKMRKTAYIGDLKFSDFEDQVNDNRDAILTPDDGTQTPIGGLLTTLSHRYVKRNDVSIESGDLVKLDQNNELVKADSAKDTGIVGILWEMVDYSIKPHKLDKYLKEERVFVEKDHHYRDSFGVKLAEADRGTKSLWTVAALGDSVEGSLLGMKICNQNGDVAIGDLLCSSDTPGYLMKQPVEYAVVDIVDGVPQYEERQVINSFTVGKCMSSVNFDGNGKAEGVYGYLYCG